MPASIQITGGGFQDCRGNAIALGKLVMRPVADAVVSSSQVAAGRICTISLDGSGNISGTVLVWPTTYTVSVYSAAGQLVWGPHTQVVPNSSPFSISTWVPS